MQTSVEAIYENGIFRPLTEIALPEGQRVQLAVSPVAKTNGEAEQDPAFNLAEMAEEIGITNLATNIDHYLYGLPKRVE